MSSQVVSDFRNLLADSLKETGIDLQRSASEVAAYAAERTAALALAVGQPGFEEAVRAERDSVALFAGVQAVQNADRADQRLVGLIQGFLFAGARLIAPPPV